MTIQTVKALIDADVPVILWGPPGVGKTSAVRALAEQTGARLEVLIGSTIDPVDVGGYLVPDVHGVVRSSPPPWARRLRDALDAGRSSWLFLDELSCAPPSVQAALLRVILDRRVGELDLGGCRVLAAANPSDTAADGGDLAAATANRFAHVEWTVDPAAWVRGTLAGWGKPIAPATARAAARVCAFIRRSPQALLAVPKDAEASARAWPSPRSWSAAIAALAHASQNSARAVVAACVGDAAASEWATYDAAADLPDPEDVLAGRAKLPSRGDQCHATLFAVVAAALADHPDRARRIDQVWQFLAEVRPDVALTSAAALLDATGDVPDVARDLGRRILKLKDKSP